MRRREKAREGVRRRAKACEGARRREKAREGVRRLESSWLRYQRADGRNVGTPSSSTGKPSYSFMRFSSFAPLAMRRMRKRRADHARARAAGCEPENEAHPAVWSRVRAPAVCGYHERSV